MDQFHQRVTHKKGPIAREDLELGMLVATRGEGPRYQDRVKALVRSGVTLGSKPGVSLMFGRGDREWELLEDFDAEVIPLGTLAIGPAEYREDHPGQWWVWSHRRQWQEIGGVKGWSGANRRPVAGQLVAAHPAGADELTGLAMIYTPGGKAVMAGLWSPAVAGGTSSSRFPEVWIDPTDGEVYEDPEVAQHLRAVPAEHPVGETP